MDSGKVVAKMRKMKKESIFLTVVAAAILLLVAPVARTQSPAHIKDNDEKVRLAMIQISKELGTTCTECHSVSNFKDDAKNSFKTALKHLKVVAAMKANGMDGKSGPEANCYMCHRGELRPPSHSP